MSNQSLRNVLFVASALVFAAGTLEYLMLGVLLLPPFVVSLVLAVLGFVANSMRKTVAAISLLLAIVLPIGAVAGYLQGALVVAVPVFDALLFGYVGWIAFIHLRSDEDRAIERSDFSVGQKIVHWLMAFLITMDLFVAQKLGGVMEDWDRLESRVDHGTLGTIVAVLFLLRIFLRGRRGAPPLPAGMPDWQVWAAKAGHRLLYFFIGFLILSGLLTASNATAPVPLFGAFDVTIGQTEETAFIFLRQFHEFATKAVIALIAIHVVAAIYHHFVAKDDSTVKMLRFWKSSGS